MPDHIGEKCRCCSSASLLFLWTKIANLLETAAWKRAFPDAHARVTHAKALKVSPSFAQLSAPLNFAARYRLPASTAAKSTKAMQAAPAFGYCGRTGKRNSPWARQTGTYYYGTWLEPNLEDKTRSQSDRANEQWRKRFSFPQKKKKLLTVPGCTEMWNILLQCRCQHEPIRSTAGGCNCQGDQRKQGQT